jgi:hypothetical protein
VEHRPLPQVAQQFGYSYGGLRNLVTDFRACCRTSQTPPFSPHRAAGAHPIPARARHRVNRNPPPSLTVANSPSPQGVACAAVWPASSCSYRC